MSYQRKINNLLMDGQWHDFEDIFSAVRRGIDPSVADKEYRKRHPFWKSDPQMVRVEKGKRRLVILHLISMKARYQVDGCGPSGDQSFRMTREAIKARRERLVRRLVSA